LVFLLLQLLFGPLVFRRGRVYRTRFTLVLGFLPARACWQYYKGETGNADYEPAHRPRQRTWLRLAGLLCTSYWTDSGGTQENTTFQL
jgi:hypothetical protein